MNQPVNSASPPSPDESLLLDVGFPWYVVHTQPRREDVAEASLRKWCARVFCPRYRRRGILRGYVRHVVRPLFPGYLFAAFDARRDFQAVHYARGVRGVVVFGGVPAVVPPDLLGVIEAHMENGYVVLLPSPLRPGQRVEIVAGCFRGHTGICHTGVKGSERVAILLDTLKYQGRIVLDRSAVSPV